MDFTIREEFNAPVSKVYGAFTDVAAFAEWLPDIVRIETLTDAPFGVGTKWRETRKMFGKEASEVFEVVAATPGKRIELFVDGRQGSSKRGEYRFTYDFQERDGKTKLDLHASITGMGWAGVLFGWLFKGMFRKAIKKDHEALRRFVEAS
jgi:uncharacterized protein YndB with AHSA1/START domain